MAYAGLSTHRKFHGHSWNGAGVTRSTDEIAEETPVALVYNRVPHVVMMASPQDLEDFALGFSMSEGIVNAASEVESIKVMPHPEGIEINLAIVSERFALLEGKQRNLTGRTGCGLCGAQTLAQAIRHPGAVADNIAISHAAVQRAGKTLLGKQPLNSITGSVHAAAWADERGEIELVREDVGRHNALDKLIGAMLGAGMTFNRGFLLLTSRASYEMIQKAATVGIEIVAAVSGPTALAIRLAEESGVTLIAFTRTDRHTIYAHAQRITDARKHRAA